MIPLPNGGVVQVLDPAELIECTTPLLFSFQTVSISFPLITLIVSRRIYFYWPIRIRFHSRIKS